MSGLRVGAKEQLYLSKNRPQGCCRTMCWGCSSAHRAHQQHRPPALGPSAASHQCYNTGSDWVVQTERPHKSQCLIHLPKQTARSWPHNADALYFPLSWTFVITMPWPEAENAPSSPQWQQPAAPGAKQQGEGPGKHGVIMTGRDPQSGTQHILSVFSFSQVLSPN